jgi:excinuclease UvrABC nuclease subunit
MSSASTIFDGAWTEVGGVYVFVKWVAGKGCVPLYVGKADSFRNRLCASHECWGNAVLHGATRVLAHVVLDSIERENLEQRLIGRYKPPLNVQHNRAFGGA